MRRRQLFLMGVTLVALSAVLCNVSQALLTAGDTAPNFTLYRHGTTEPVSLYDFEGEIVLLDFFAHWCVPCRLASSELEPNIQQYYDNLGGNPAGVPVNLVSICVNDITDPETDDYIAQYGLELVLDDFGPSVFYDYSTGGIPRFAIINGVQSSNFDPWEIIYIHAGYSSNRYSTFRNYINQVVPSNERPVAVNDTYGLDEDGSLFVSSASGVLDNDTDLENDPLTAIGITGTEHGSLTLYSDGSLNYTPEANYNGTDTFTYKANDGTSDSLPATVTLNIASVNDVPVAEEDSYTVAPDQLLTLYPDKGVLVNDIDIDDDPLTASLVSSTSNGYLSLLFSGGFQYFPTSGFSGRDSFVYRAFDGTAYSDPTTVYINVGSLPGDATGDGKVDQEDASVLAANWGDPTTGGVSAGDFNKDGVVNAADASIMAANWGSTFEGIVVNDTPEPSSLAMLLGIVLAAACRRRTRPC